MGFEFPSQGVFCNLGGERIFFFPPLSAPTLVGELPAGLEGALGMGLGCWMLPGWETPQPLLPQVPGGSGKVGGRSWGLEKV